MGRMNMAKTLGDITQELNDKVLAPAKAEAAEIVRSAKEQAAAIVAEAQAAAEKAGTAAKTDAENVRKQLQVDMDTAARNFIIMVQEKLEAAVVVPVVDGEVKKALGDDAFLKRIIEILLTEFLKNRSKAQPIEILLPKQNQTELEAWFREKFRDKAGRISRREVYRQDHLWLQHRCERPGCLFQLQLRSRGSLLQLLLAAFPQTFLRTPGVLGEHGPILFSHVPASSHACRTGGENAARIRRNRRHDQAKYPSRAS